MFGDLWDGVKKGWNKGVDLLKKGWSKGVGLLKKGWDIAKEAFFRFLGLGDAALCALGVRPKKYLRFQVYVLRRNGSPVVDMNWVNERLEKTRDILKREANITLSSTNVHFGFTETLADNAPAYALSPPKFSATSAFSDADDYFRERATQDRTGVGEYLADASGYGEPIYAFIVWTMEDEKWGAVYSIASNYCVVSSSSALTTMAHEIGHCCGLLHISSRNNLMKSTRNDKDKDSELSGSQVCVMRNSRFVTYFRHGSEGIPAQSSTVPALSVATAPMTDWPWIVWS